MKRNTRKNLKDTKGITLVALLVTLIVLLILAAVSLSAVFSEKGIFSRAEKAGNRYNEAKAREVLETVLLVDGQYEKHTNPKYNQDDFLNELIKKEIEGAEVTDDTVIVGGYMYELDRSVPKIGKYLGIADGVIITATIKQNGDWQNPTATVTGTIKTYSGGNIINSTATVVSGNANVSSFPTKGGDYTIENITEDTEIKITAKDNKDKSNEKTVKVHLVRDTTPPTLSNAKAEASGKKIKISVNAEDKESGLKEIRYSVNPKTLDPATTAEGKIESGKEIELTATEENREYTVIFTAEDNVGNSSTAEAKATIIGVRNFSYTGTVEEVDLPAGTYLIEAKGAEGGKGVESNGRKRRKSFGNIYFQRGN